MRRISNRNRFFDERLILDTYLIGYKDCGESIVFIIYADGNIVYSGVIDCYEYNNLNKTIEILNQHNIDNLDLICWTHPDEDHSIGIDSIIDLYAGENTKVYLPGHINGTEYDYNNRVKSTFDKINQTIRSKKIKKYGVYDISDKKTLEYKTFTHMVKGTYEFTISSIAPNSMILRRNDFNKTFKKNDYSIGLILNLGEFNFLFAGDIENRTIDKMEDFYFPDFIDYIKTPHHTSNSSDKLLGYLDYENKCEVVCTTVFRKHKLPNQDMIKRYRNYTRSFYSTGSLNSNDKEAYGLINVKCDIVNKRMTTVLQGNSEKIYGLDCKCMVESNI